MYKPNKVFLFSLVGYCLLIKVLPFLLVHFGLDLRVVSLYPWSFTPIFAVAMFGAARFANLKSAYGLPLLVWLLADVVIGLSTGLVYGVQEGLAYSLYPGQFVNYAGLLLVCSCGLLLRRTHNWLATCGVLLLGPTLFFLLSNFGVWAIDIGIDYPRNWAGLVEAYTAGLPFYRSQLISTLAFGGLLFSPLGMSQLQSLPARPAPASAPVIE